VAGQAGPATPSRATGAGFPDGASLLDRNDHGYLRDLSADGSTALEAFRIAGVRAGLGYRQIVPIDLGLDLRGGRNPRQRAQAGWPAVKSRGTDDRHVALPVQASHGEIGSGVNHAQTRRALLGLTRRQTVERLLEEHEAVVDHDHAFVVAVDDMEE
jgi:hypothetical protein